MLEVLSSFFKGIVFEASAQLPGVRNAPGEDMPPLLRNGNGRSRDGAQVLRRMRQPAERHLRELRRQRLDQRTVPRVPASQKVVKPRPREGRISRQDGEHHLDRRYRR